MDKIKLLWFDRNVETVLKEFRDLSLNHDVRFLKPSDLRTAI